MCTGRVDPAHIIRAFSNGADGVYVGGCWPGECHYVTEGNYHALGMIQLTRRILKFVGINPERLQLEWLGASEGIRFAEVMNSVSAKIKSLGPLGKAEGIGEDALAAKLEAVKNVLPWIKLVERERLRVPANTVEEYEKFFASDDAERLFRELIADKLETSQIMALLREGPLSNAEISQILGMETGEVARLVNVSVRQGLVKLDEKQKVLLLPGVREQARAERA
jgi:F420-non-reducing hydrogenase iron-sulfur subunit